MYERLRNLFSPPFIICLVLLIVNDFVFKHVFHNAITGKLSDFCGLFVFSVFWSTVFPRFKGSVFVLTGLFFVFWKSAYASGLIEWLNTFFKIERTIDPTDLMALIVLPLGWLHLKGEAPMRIPNSLFTRLGSSFIALVAIFSFCATSQRREIQSFDQPQYVLLRCDSMPDAKLYSELGFYKKGPLLVVKVSHLYVNPSFRADDYSKNRSVENLDLDALQRVERGASLIPIGIINVLSVETEEGKDSLRFNGGRLDGRFVRTKNGKVIIEGFYKNGLEDSIWTLTDTASNKVVKLAFVNGERTRVEQLLNGKVVSSNSVNTRADTIRNTYITIALLIGAIIVIILMLHRNYRKTFPNQLSIKRIWKWLICLVAPVFVWLIHLGVSVLLTDYKPDIFGTLAAVFFIYIIICPLMFIVVFSFKIRKEIDILLYLLLFGLACSVWTTCWTVIELTK